MFDLCQQGQTTDNVQREKHKLVIFKQGLSAREPEPETEIVWTETVL